MTTKFLIGTFMTTKFLVFISSFYFFCCVPILCWKSWSFVLVAEHQVSYATHFTILSKKSVFWYVGPFCRAFLGPNISLFGGRMVLAPTLNSNSSRSHSIKSLLSAQFKRFWFFILPPDRKSLCLLIILFLRSSTIHIHGDSDMCSHHRMNSIFQWSCTFWQGLFSLDIFLETFFHSNLSICLAIFVMWQSIVFHSHCISAVLTFKSYTSWFWKE